MFSEPVSEVYVHGPWPTSITCTWLHVDLHVFGQTLSSTLKNTNRDWLRGLTNAKQSSRILPWLGALPTAFTNLKAALLGRLAQARAARLSTALTYIALMELLLEYHKEKYPLDLLQ